MIKKINTKNFLGFGRVIEYPRILYKLNGKNLFRIILRESAALGWRIAYLVVRDKAIARLEQHLETYESLEPLRGKALLYVAKNKDPRNIECFYLNRPVILKKGIWHGIVSVGKECEIKITENAKVKCLYWKLGFILNQRVRLFVANPKANNTKQLLAQIVVNP